MITVTSGWSGEDASGKWRKTSCCLDASDLNRYLLERIGEGVTEDLVSHLTVVQTFSGVQALADQLTLSVVFSQFGLMSPEQFQAATAPHKAILSSLTAKVTPND